MDSIQAHRTRPKQAAPQRGVVNESDTKKDKEGIDMKHQKTMRSASPFDDSATGRLVHMGLLDAAGRVAVSNTAALGHIIAGLFFNDLCDHYNDTQAVLGVYEDLNDHLVLRDYRRLLVRFSLQYDIMHQPLPAIVWWLSGTKDLVQAFLDYFMQAMSVLIKELTSEQLGEEIH